MLSFKVTKTYTSVYLVHKDTIDQTYYVSAIYTVKFLFSFSLVFLREKKVYNDTLKSEIDKSFKRVCIRKMFIIFKCSDSHLVFHIVLKPGKGN